MSLTIPGSPVVTPTTSTSAKDTDGTDKIKDTKSTGGGVSGSSNGQGIPSPSSGGSGSTTATSSTTGTPSGPSGQVQERLSTATISLKDALKLLDGMASALKDPDKLASLLIEMQGMQRQNAMDQRLASRDVAKSQLMGQAAESREAAVKEIAAAAVSLVMAVVSFAVAVGGAAKMGGQLKEGTTAGMKASTLADKAADVRNAMEGVTDQKQLSKMSKELGALESAAKKFENLSNSSFRNVDITKTFSDAFSGLAQGLGEGMAAMLRASAKFDEAQGQEFAAGAQDTQADADQMKSFMDGIDEILRSAMEFIKQMNDAEVELMASASRL